MSDKIDGLGEGYPTERKELEARIERLSKSPTAWKIAKPQRN